MDLSQLPDLVLLGVFRHLGVMELLRMRGVCRRWRDLLQHSHAWQGHGITGFRASCIRDANAALRLAPFLEELALTSFEGASLLRLEEIAGTTSCCVARLTLHITRSADGPVAARLIERQAALGRLRYLSVQLWTAEGPLVWPLFRAVSRCRQLQELRLAFIGIMPTHLLLVEPELEPFPFAALAALADEQLDRSVPDDMSLVQLSPSLKCLWLTMDFFESRRYRSGVLAVAALLRAAAGLVEIHVAIPQFCIDDPLMMDVLSALGAHEQAAVEALYVTMVRADGVVHEPMLQKLAEALPRLPHLRYLHLIHVPLDRNFFHTVTPKSSPCLKYVFLQVQCSKSTCLHDICYDADVPHLLNTNTDVHIEIAGLWRCSETSVLCGGGSEECGCNLEGVYECDLVGFYSHEFVEQCELECSVDNKHVVCGDAWVQMEWYV